MSSENCNNKNNTACGDKCASSCTTTGCSDKNCFCAVCFNKPEKLQKFRTVNVPTAIPDTSSATGRAVVATIEKTASAVALQVIRNGGNAFDAAVAAMAMISLTRPGNGGPLGGGFATLYQACTKKVYFINGRERSPRSARSTMFLDSHGIQLPFNVAISQGSAVGVPGTIALMDKIRQFGRVRKWKSLVKPTIDLANSGYTVDAQFYDRVLAQRWKLLNFTYSKNLFLSASGNNPLPIGATFKNPDLAGFWSEFSKKGVKWFYSGSFAQELTSAVQNFTTLRSPSVSFSNPLTTYSYNNPTPSLSANYSIGNASMTVDDLQAYESPVTHPLSFSYRGNKIFSAPPPSSGGLTIAETLKALEPFNLSSMPLADAYALFINSNAAAFADRNAYVADAHVVNVPIEGLMSDAYIATRSALLTSTGYIGPVAPGNPFLYQPNSVSGPGINLPNCRYEEHQLETLNVGKPLTQNSCCKNKCATTKCNCSECKSTDDCLPRGCTNHIVIADYEGNVASVTFTIEQIFGGGASLPGRGLVLNNEMTDFNFGGFAPVYPTVSVSGNTTTGSSIITGITPNTTGIVPGQFIYDNNTSLSAFPIVSFPNGTVVLSVDSTSQITVSNNALLSNSSTPLILTPTTVTQGAFSPGGANEAASFKQPRSSMTPTIVLNNENQPIMALGAAGGATIIPTVSQELFQTLDLGYSVTKTNNFVRFLNTNGTSTPSVNGDPAYNQSALISALNAKSPSFNITPSPNVQGPTTFPTALTFQNPAKKRGQKTADGADVFQDTPTAPGFTTYHGSALSLP